MSNSDNEIIPIVDLNDEIIGYKARKDITNEDIYRVTYCWIIDVKGNILLSKRSMNKKQNAGIWSRPVAGTVSKGETYIDNIIKEIKEEINISVSKDELILGPKIQNTKENNFFIQWFVLIYKGNKIQIQGDSSEIEKLERYSKPKLLQLIQNGNIQLTRGSLWGLYNIDTA